jgi:16S rRNA (cytosine967-C5)-methyltransferase
MVRWQRLYDAVCDPLLRRGEQPRALRIALRMLCHQLFACDRIPPHAALHATVEAAKNNGAGHLAGVVNAVGRKLVERVAAERHGDGPLGRLRPEHHPRSPGERHSLPDLLVQDLKPVLPGDTDTALAALNHVPPLCTRTMPGAAPPVGRSILRRDEAWTWWEDPQEALAGPVADGRCVVQDRAQGEVLAALRPRPGERVLDLCAAPGGKARACAEAGCRVIAADLAGPRQARLRANGAGRFAILAQDGRRPALAAGAFDAVLVDAPCSNSGVLGRRPEARWRYDRASLASLTTLQRGLLAAAAGLVGPGGRLVYSTCSLSPGENQRIAQALAGWRVLAERLTWPDAWQGGGYVAVLVRC